MMVRCRVCQELILPPVGIRVVGRPDDAFMDLIAATTRHASEKHADLFAQISAVAGQVIASLVLELFESQSQEIREHAAALRTLAVMTTDRSAYSEVNRSFELRDVANAQETEHNPN